MGNENAQTVWVVVCIERTTMRETVHIFSSSDKAAAFAKTDQRAHVLYDYVLDYPERHEMVTQ